MFLLLGFRFQRGVARGGKPAVRPSVVRQPRVEQTVTRRPEVASTPYQQTVFLGILRQLAAFWGDVLTGFEVLGSQRP